MNVWRVRLINEKDRITNNPTWIVCTFGGTSELEITDQIKKAKRSVAILYPNHKMEFDIEIIEFNAMGVARL